MILTAALTLLLDLRGTPNSGALPALLNLYQGVKELHAAASAGADGLSDSDLN